MTVRFLHAADIHLGYRQYNAQERHDNFTRAFEALVEDALARRVDFVLLAGDLFHRRVIEPRTFLQAVSLLQRLRDGGVPAIAVEGNHERAHYHEGFSWLDCLAEMGYLMVLNPRYEQGQLHLDPWDPHRKEGAYVDFPGGVRVVGVKYYGASTPRVIQDLEQALARLSAPRPAYSILMLHAGLQGILDQYSATLTRADLERLRPYTDYLALGHIHKPFVQDDWIYNPGSLETTSVTEVEWEDRGYFVVELDSAACPPHTVERIRSVRRRFLCLTFSVDRYESPEALYVALKSYLASEATGEVVAQKPVVEVKLTGILAFSRADLEVGRVEAMVQDAFRPLLANIRDITTPSGGDISVVGRMSRAELERHVLREMLEDDVRRRGDSERWADMVLTLKKMALGGSEPRELVAELTAFRQSLAEGGDAC